MKSYLRTRSKLSTDTFPWPPLRLQERAGVASAAERHPPPTAAGSGWRLPRSADRGGWWPGACHCDLQAEQQHGQRGKATAVHRAWPPSALVPLHVGRWGLRERAADIKAALLPVTTFFFFFSINVKPDHKIFNFGFLPSKTSNFCFLYFLLPQTSGSLFIPSASCEPVSFYRIAFFFPVQWI